MDANERICCAKEISSRARFQNDPHALTPRNKRRRIPARRPSAGHQLPSPRLAQTSPACRATPSSRLMGAVLGLCAFAGPPRSLAAPAPTMRLLDEDARLRQTLTVRVSRMPLADLLHRMNAALSVRLGVEGEEVADQRIDLFTGSVPATGILQAITGLLNAEGPRGYRWERRGQKPDDRYVLVRDLASRQWEAQRAAEADQQVARLLRARITAYGSEPFRPSPDRPRELPGMRRPLASLSDAQLTQLLSERLLVLTTATALPHQQPLLKDVVAQMADLQRRQRPELAEQQFALFGPPDKDPSARAEIYLWGDRLFVRWLLAGLPMPPEMEETLAVEAEADRQRSVGQPLPELRIEDASGKSSPLRPGGPLLLYVAPAWPRPAVTTSETFSDLKAVERLRGNGGSRPWVLVVGTGGGAAELRAWRKERGVGLPPLALAREPAERLGAHGLPLALIVDRQGHIAWRKEGYDPGDAAEWQRRLERLP
jgi:hypothetical protein